MTKNKESNIMENNITGVLTEIELIGRVTSTFYLFKLKLIFSTDE